MRGTDVVELASERVSSPAYPGIELFAEMRSPWSYASLLDIEPMSRINEIQSGLPAAYAKLLLEMPELSRSTLLSALDLSVATFNKKVRDRDRLSTSEGERVIGFARLVGQVERMVSDAGEVASFDARAWLARWLTEPLPALGNVRPLDMMKTMEGQSLVSDKLAQIASGAYA